MRKIDWIQKLQFFLQTTALCLAIAAIQFAFRPHVAYEYPLVYSLCIGTFTWALIDFGRDFFASADESGWPQGKSALVLPLVGIVGGYALGTWVADTWFGQSSWDAQSLPQLRVSILITAVAGMCATYLFYTKGKNAHLETKVAEAKAHASEAKLKLLETQIEPHMLFNTLANLRALIGTDPAAAVHMLDRLNDYLRATLAASRTPFHPLQTEFDRLRDYLELMAVRMGPRLQFTLELPAALASHPVPTLLLQPLVENAIKHGLEPKVDGGSIFVRARQTGDMITLEVSDTGVGLAPTTPSATPGAETGSGFGLTQVRERLATIYGATGAMLKVANNTIGTGAIITFSSKMMKK